MPDGVEEEIERMVAWDIGRSRGVLYNGGFFCRWVLGDSACVSV